MKTRKPRRSDEMITREHILVALEEVEKTLASVRWALGAAGLKSRWALPSTRSKSARKGKGKGSIYTPFLRRGIQKTGDCGVTLDSCLPSLRIDATKGTIWR